MRPSPQWAAPSVAVLLLTLGSGCGSDPSSSTAHDLGITRAALSSADCPAGYNIILGTPGPDVLNGTAGNDCILGLAGDDVIDGRAGLDVLIGGAGNDTLSGGAAADTLYGEGGNDVLFGGAGEDRLDGGEGDDLLQGEAGNDQLAGGSGDDVLQGGAGNDSLDGNEGDDQLSGGAGNDSLDGGGGNDALEGGAGNDSLLGGPGSDAVRSSGNDTVNGGAGNDACDGDGCEMPQPAACTLDADCAAGLRCFTVPGMCLGCLSDSQCSDGNACTQGETCQAGTCSAGAPVVCDPPGQCQVPGTCNPATGACSTRTAPDGSQCALPSGAPASCQSGQCVASSCDGRHLDCNGSSGDGCELASSQSYAGGASALVSGDFDADGHLDLAAVSPGEDQVVVQLGSGGGALGSPVSYAVGREPRALALGDLNRDGIGDLVVANSEGDSLSVLLGKPGGLFASAVEIAVPDSFPVSVAVGDVTGDGKPDVAIGSHYGTACYDCGDNAVLLFVGDGQGGLAFRAKSGIYFDGVRSVAIADFDHDGFGDIAAATEGYHVGNSGFSLFFGDAQGSLARNSHHSAGYWTYSLAVQDLDGDGDADVVTAERESDTVSVFLNDGSGQFTAHSFSAGNHPLGIAVGDFDRDGVLDLAAAGFGPLRVFRGDGAGNYALLRQFDGVGVHDGVGDPRMISADFDGDGEPELALAANAQLDIVMTGCPTAPPAVVDASATLRWQTSIRNAPLLAWPDGSLLLEGPDAALHVTETSTPPYFVATPTRGAVASAIWTNPGAPLDVGGYQDRRAFRPSGALSWEWIQLGCCNTPFNPVAIDAAAGVGYQINNALIQLDLREDAPQRVLASTPGHIFGELSLANGMAFSSLQYDPWGAVERWDLATMTSLGTTDVAPGSRLFNAVDASGALVVTSASGVLARIERDGRLAFQLQVGASTPPVISARGLILYGAGQRLQAFSPTLGAVAWSRALPSPVTDLLVADHGLVYALLAADRSVYALDSATGTVRQIFTNLPNTSAWQFLLQSSTLYISLGDRVVALPVPSLGYEAGAPWPVRFHDNQRTGNLASALQPACPSHADADADGVADCIDVCPSDAADACRGLQVQSLTTGYDHSCALFRDGRVKCWGHNEFGQLGLGDAIDRGNAPNQMGNSLPFVDLGSGVRATQIDAGQWHTCALLEDHRIKCWGINSSGQLGLGDTANRGDNPGEMGDALGFVDLGAGQIANSISSNGGNTCALLADGRMRCWGYNGQNQLARDAYGDSWGDAPGEMGDALGFPNLGTGLLVAQPAMGGSHECALFEPGTVKCWAYNFAGSLGLGDTLPRARPTELGDALPFVDLGNLGAPTQLLASMGSHTCALFGSGRLSCWGDNSSGQLGLGDTAARGDEPGEMGNGLGRVALGTGETVLAVGAGVRETCAVLSGGRLKCWGDNSQGQLGQGDTATRGDNPDELGDALSPIALGNGARVQAVDAGNNHTCALLESGRVKCWGHNRFGQLGLGDALNRGDDPNEMGDALPAVDLGTP